MKNSLKVEVADNTKLTDQLNTYKRWFNGVKHFFTVKTLPPPR